MTRFNIRVTKDDRNQFKFEMMSAGEKIADVTRDEIFDMAGALVDSLRANKDHGNIITLRGHEITASYVDLIEMLMQFASSLRWREGV